MVNGGDRDRSRIENQIGGQHCLDRGKHGDSEVGFGLGGPARVRFDCCHQRDALPGRLELTVNAEMIAAKCARSSHGDAQNGLSRYCAVPLPSTVLRQRL
jgi:hypothetical protein